MASPVIEGFEARITAELQLSLNEIEWWKDLVGRGLVRAEDAQCNIGIETGIVNLKRSMLNC